MRQQNGCLIASTLSVYPNPAQEMVTLGGLQGNKEYKINMLNELGMTVLPETVTHSDFLGEISVAVGALRAGVYFIQVRDEMSSMTVKMVKL